MPVIESLSTANDDPLISKIRLDVQSGVRILRATVFHSPSCQTWARSLQNRKAALPDRRIKQQGAIFNFSVAN